MLVRSSRKALAVLGATALVVLGAAAPSALAAPDDPPGIEVTPSTNLAEGDLVTVSGPTAPCQAEGVDRSAIQIVVMEAARGEAYPINGQSVAGDLLAVPDGDTWTVQHLVTPLINTYDVFDLQAVCVYDGAEGSTFIPVGQVSVTSLDAVPPEETPTTPDEVKAGSLTVTPATGVQVNDILTVTGSTEPCKDLDPAKAYVLVLEGLRDSEYPEILSGMAGSTMPLPEGDTWTLEHPIATYPETFDAFDILAVCGTDEEDVAIPVGRTTITTLAEVPAPGATDGSGGAADTPSVYPGDETTGGTDGQGTDGIEPGQPAGSGEGASGAAATATGTGGGSGSSIPGAVWPIAAVAALILGTGGAFLLRRSKQEQPDSATDQEDKPSQDEPAQDVTAQEQPTLGTADTEPPHSVTVEDEQPAPAPEDQ
ncbi:MAG: hypothetical protein LBR19_04960 [Bifidobacteriaceae bacterium]|jgi:hypothetical protein|nr:hypothetical protein [Bifidobacteriaceae bacterium]